MTDNMNNCNNNMYRADVSALPKEKKTLETYSFQSSLTPSKKFSGDFFNTCLPHYLKLWPCFIWTFDIATLHIYMRENME